MAKYIIKNIGEMVKVCRLGWSSEMEQKLIEEGKIRLCNGRVSIYEIFSQNNKAGHGEIARAGDFIKIDEDGYPYPNRLEVFLENHRHINGDTWEQLPKPLIAWESYDEVTPEVQFLIDNKRLMFDAGKNEKFFVAHIKGTWVTAAVNAILIFYSVSYNEDGSIADAEFDFIAPEEFKENYHYC